MKSENLMIIDPSLEIPEIESYNNISLCSPLKTTYHLPAIHSPNTMTKNFANAKGIILMGSAASVHDSYSWISILEQIIKSAVQKHIPILGICFGHQFLAHIFGGKVVGVFEGLGMAQGARLMLSTPPPMYRLPSPESTDRAAKLTAPSAEEQFRFTVMPGTSFGNPAKRADMRATSRLSSPA